MKPKDYRADGGVRLAGSTAAYSAVVAHRNCDCGDPGRVSVGQRAWEDLRPKPAPPEILCGNDAVGRRAGRAGVVGNQNAPRSDAATAWRAARRCEGLVHGFRR